MSAGSPELDRPWRPRVEGTPRRPLPEGLTVAVEAPASTANLGPGFDCVGLALGLWDCYEVVVGGDRLVIEVEGEGADHVPRDARHLVVRCLLRGLAELGYLAPPGLTLRARNGVPHSRGIGSSATAAVAGFALASGLASLADHGAAALDRSFVNEWAARIEGHPDNSSASVYGGMTLSWSDSVGGDGGAVADVHTTRLQVHPDVVPLVLIPDIELSTAAARAALPMEVPLRAAAHNAGRSALLVQAMGHRPDLLFPATRDWLHQEQRRVAYPATMAAVDTLRAAGHAAVVSGAGPSVLILATTSSVEEARSLLPLRLPGTADVRWRAVTPGVPEHGVRLRATPC